MEKHGLDSRVLRSRRNFGEDPIVDVETHQIRAAGWEAGMAASLIERWGMVMGASDGEDSAGRHRLRIMTPEEVVDRACETSALAIAEFEARGWVLELPTLEEAEEVLKAREDARKNA